MLNMPKPEILLISVIVLFSALSAGAQTGVPSKDAEEPPAGTGVYFRSESGEWTKLLKATTYDAKTRGLERFVETDGYSYLNTTAAFDGASSPFQIEIRKPKFFIRGMAKPKDALIVMLTKKNDRREVKFSSANVSSDNRGGFLLASIRRVRATVVGDQLFSITPEESLKPGEYLIVFGEPNVGFDFGITK
jgi:hypothetical protein